ncbi:unnamed protein product [Periconia digitata]|uniref:Nucleoside phosphorylase domain-containing protein n=1 Tax=Periconia digitata TaxID=1303443 RepID=A0A9W4XPX2_9PLEO|nr:unnamed protein product [Periconia digitata]
MARRPEHDKYTVGWLCAIPIELAAARGVLDEVHEQYETGGCIFTLGSVAWHNIVVACLPAGQMGISPAAVVASKTRAAFPNIKFGLMVGIGGGVPSNAEAMNSVRLGDVVVSQPLGTFGGVIQYDMGKVTPGGFLRTAQLNSPPTILLSAIALMKANEAGGLSNMHHHMAQLESLARSNIFRRDQTTEDVLFSSDYNHSEGGQTCRNCSRDMIVQRPQRQQGREVLVHYGNIASGNKVIKDGLERDRISQMLGGILCFEMEAAGLMNHFECLVIRGICDYADSHKNKTWQAYAAGTAAAYAKELLLTIPGEQINNLPTMNESLGRKSETHIFPPSTTTATKSPGPTMAPIAYPVTLPKLHATDWISPSNFVHAVRQHVEFTQRLETAHPEISQLLREADISEWLRRARITEWFRRAEESDIPEIIEYLLDSGLDPNSLSYYCNDDESTEPACPHISILAYSWGLSMGHAKQSKIFIDLANRGADVVDYRMANGMTALHKAIQAKNRTILAEMIQRGANIHSRVQALMPESQSDLEGYTPLLLAFHFGSLSLAKLCIDRYDCEIDVKVNGSQLLEQAMLSSKDESYELVNQTVQYLLEHGADPNSFGFDGEPLCFLARRLDRRDFFWSLIEHGVNVNVRNRRGTLLIVDAILQSETDVVEAILKTGTLTIATCKTAMPYANNDSDGRWIRRLLNGEIARLKSGVPAPTPIVKPTTKVPSNSSSSIASQRIELQVPSDNVPRRKSQPTVRGRMKNTLKGFFGSI